MNKKYNLIDAQNIAHSRGGLCLSKEYRSYNHKLKWQCILGHIWENRFSKIKSGQWCPICSSNLSERIVRVYFEAAFNSKFQKARPDWLRIEQNTQLELDGYSKKLGIAFEHHGNQHYKQDGFFVRSEKEFNRRKFLDKEKLRLCNKNNIVLIIIPDLFSQLKLINLSKFIKQQALKLDLQLIDNWENKINIQSAYTPDEIDILTKLACIIQQKEGFMVLESYRGVITPLLLTCKNGHTWKTKIFRVLKGAWCKACHLEKIHKCNTTSKKVILQIIQNHGGKLLHTIITGNREKYKVQCKNNHQWMISRSKLLNNRWCQQCAIVKNSTKQKHTIEYMNKLAKELGGICLSTTYNSCNHYLKWKCNCGNIWDAMPRSITRGHWCPKCAHIKTAKNLLSKKFSIHN